MPDARFVVDNCIFVLGLNELYRERMKRHERNELLDCARTVATALNVSPAQVPIEGYYGENRDLTEYFRLLRALQAVDISRVGEVRLLPKYQRLDEVTSAPIFGWAGDRTNLLVQARDSLHSALDGIKPNWSVESLVSAAHAHSHDKDDFSLGGLAALTRDAVTLAAVRESVVLYSELVVGCAMQRVNGPFEWAVDPTMAERTKRFIDTFRQLFQEELPEPVARNAERYWRAYETAHVLGRCVCLGTDDTVAPPRYYHWAIRSHNGTEAVHEFWSSDRWTTDRYRHHPPVAGELVLTAWQT